MVINRDLFNALAAATSIAALATPASGAPPIAYAKEAGTRYELYLANTDGSGTVKLYTTAARIAIGVLDMNPAANEVAFAETRTTGFKIVRYNDAGGSPSVTRYDDGCYVDYLDYHPSDGSLLVMSRCLNPQVVQIRVWTNGVFGPALISTDGQNEAFSNLRWLGDGSGFLIVHSNTTESMIERRNMSNPSAPTTIWSRPGLGSGPSSLDVARCQGGPLANCSKLLYTEQTGNIRELTFSDTGGETDTFKFVGSDGHYSPDNSRILYRAPAAKSGYTLNVTSPAGTVAGKGMYAGKDWRP